MQRCLRMHVLHTPSSLGRQSLYENPLSHVSAQAPAVCMKIVARRNRCHEVSTQFVLHMGNGHVCYQGTSKRFLNVQRGFMCSIMSACVAHTLIVGKTPTQSPSRVMGLDDFRRC
jgi:hypothetical protein